MNEIHTIAPISIDNLKKYFIDNTIKFNIDYKNSTLKGNKFLIYLGNLGVPCDLDTIEDDEFLDLLTDYFNARTLVNIPKLESAAIEVLLGSKNLLDENFNGVLDIDQITTFIEKNKEVINKWTRVLESLTLYNMKTVNVTEFHDFVESFPADDTTDPAGINFVSILKYQDFYSFYQIINESNLTNFRPYFSEYIFKGKNLFSFWANEENPLFLLTSAIANGQIEGGDLDRAIDPLLEELQNSQI